jgi:hypothetical protein
MDEWEAEFSKSDGLIPLVEQESGHSFGAGKLNRATAASGVMLGGE